MKKIYLFCSAGMSTSMLANAMQQSADSHNLPLSVKAFPHNKLGEIIDDQIDEQGETSVEDILKVIKGPDFPTGGTILGTGGINEAYRTGRGKIRVRAVTD
ncbi:PTS sugar transporter subunit IIB, partial [Faecalibaculum rodentium]|uniref:PTS sugar transporter subunit IIB n=1 Tax=Faecalibaculum rodentium TaxID=1702221 RepID=UPI00256EE99A